MAWNQIPTAEWLETEEQIVSAADYLLESGRVNGLAYDTETTGLLNFKDIPLMFSLSDGIRRFAAMADPWLFHPGIKDRLLGNPEITKIGTNIKFDMHMSANVGVHLVGPIEDTLVMSWLHNENRFGHGLKDTARDYCGLKMLEFKEVFPMRKGTAKLRGETPGEAIMRVMADYTNGGREKAIEYAGLDAYATHRVRSYLMNQLMNEAIRPGWSLWDHFKQWECDFTRLLWNCERRGMTICTGHLKGKAGPMQRAMEETTGKIAELAGWKVNLASPKQLQKLFFEQLKYQPISYTDSKQPSTDADVLGEFEKRGCPFAKLILQHRKIAKIYGTYVEGLLGWVDSNLRVHTTLKQGGAVTGRLSSTEPNLQNIPRPGTDDYKIREAFTCPPGKTLVVADYDQLEMKLMAHFSQDPKMVDAIQSGKDLHCYTVELMFGEKYEEVLAAKKAKDKATPQQELLVLKRQSAKAVGFGLIYGIGPQKLAGQLTEELKREVSKEEAQQDIRKYFNAFPGVERFIKETHASCHQTEYVQTLLGRKRRLPQINAKGGGNNDPDGKGLVAEARRQSVNSIIQGTASDVAKAAMLRAEHDPLLRSLGAMLLMQIHDELIFEVDDIPEVIKQVEDRVKVIMEHPFGDDFNLSVPLTTEAHHAYTWMDAK
jgi:DNA polymerase-1